MLLAGPIGGLVPSDDATAKTTATALVNSGRLVARWREGPKLMLLLMMMVMVKIGNEPRQLGHSPESSG